MLEKDGSSKGLLVPLNIHKILFGAYFPAWRQYIASLEKKLLPEVSQLAMLRAHGEFNGLINVDKYDVRNVYRRALARGL